MTRIKSSSTLLAIVLCCTVFYFKTSAQNKYWVSFTVKTATHFDPYTFFDPKTIENRKQQGLPLSDWYDLPVDASFITAVTRIADSAGYSSRWLNGMAVYATKAKLQKIASLHFVAAVEPMALQAQPASYKEEPAKEDTANPETKVASQVGGLEGAEMIKHGLTGKGIRIAILDVGFQNADKHVAFQYLRDHNAIKLSYDFIHRKENVYNYGAHGTAVLSCIAGKYHGVNMGLAPDAEFLLARTEREATEYKDEEDAWVAAAEWAEKHGAQMISCSLGYTYQRYFYQDMNGRTSIAARGAAAAARKGMLVCIAAGNEADDKWKFVTTPGDADSVLTVGGYDPLTGYHSSFSSYGPTADGRVKPNVIAAGTAWVATPTGYGSEQGTSFATPLMAGFAACVWQQLHSKTNMQILDTVQKLGNLYPYFDYAQGYGIPKASYLFEPGHKNDSAFTLYEETGGVRVSISTSYFNDSVPKAEKLKNNYLYAKLSDPSGRIKDYQVIKVQKQRFELTGFKTYLLDKMQATATQYPDGSDAISYPKGWVLSVFFDGCFRTYKF